MSVNALRRFTACIALTVLVCVACVALPGCGKKTQSTTGETTPAVTAPTETEKPAESNATTPDKAVKETSPETPGETQPTSPGTSSEVDAVTRVALAAARANNPDLPELKVLNVKIIDTWARVDLEPEDKSTDAASAFLRKADGTWTVFDFGTGIGPDQYPDAPPELFQ